MGHFAKIDENNIVTEVIVIANENLLDEDGDEQETLGQTFIAETLKLEGNWQQTSYNHTIRGRFAGIGYSWDEENDHFISPQPYPSWTYNFDEAIWEAPVDYPTLPPQDQEDQGEQFATGNDEYVYIWNEEDQSWDWTLIESSQNNGVGIDLSDPE